ncbi:MAG: hypothetical protein ACLRMZ_21615 [Blautia marasmi]
MGKRKKKNCPVHSSQYGCGWYALEFKKTMADISGDPSKSRKEFDVKVPEPGMENEVPDDLSAFQNPPMTKEERRDHRLS